MGKEIEKKYLLPAYPAAELESGALRLVSTERLYQTYLAYTGLEEIRVRQSVDREGRSTFTHTFKSGHGLVREEVEFHISEALYKQLLGNSGLIPLEKVRTTVESDGLKFEIDDYKQIALLVVEVEFPDLDAAQRFTPPAWFGRELGQEEEYRNKTLWLQLQRGESEADAGER